MASFLNTGQLSIAERFDIPADQRHKILDKVCNSLDDFYSNTESRKTTLPITSDAVQQYVKQMTLDDANNPDSAIQHVIQGLETYAVHTPHPSYYGLFNPRANFASILADLITAVFNPQMAAWSHAPFAVEVENHLIQEFGKQFGLPADQIDGTFAAGGAEANLTAVICAMNQLHPEFATSGLFGIKKRPIIYSSTEAHHSIQKAARSVGLGLDSVKLIPVNSDLTMNIDELKTAIELDLKKDRVPMMVVGTAGTTGAGVIDDLVAISSLAKQYGAWFHVDAAYAGAAAISPNLRDCLNGIEHADSITFDAHKWLSVPMGASLFLTSKVEILHQTFRITTDYMPSMEGPYAKSIQWSRRFIGLKVYLSLLFHGWSGYAEVIDHQADMGNQLRELLVASGWSIKNSTRLPIVCFTDDEFDADENFAAVICEQVVQSGDAWISIYPIDGKNMLRACICNYATTEKEIAKLVQLLNGLRDTYQNKSSLAPGFIPGPN